MALRKRVWMIGVQLIPLLWIQCKESVAPPPNQTVTSVTVTPTPQALLEGATQQFTATPRDQAGNPVTGRTITWSSSATGIASVNSTGVVEAVAPGNATITAAVGTVTGQASVSVTLAVLYAAGDIADCAVLGDDSTAKQLDNLTGGILALGDLAYPSGSTQDFSNCYGPTWGRHKARTFPAPGNHEYQTAGAAGYYAYWGTQAGDPAKGYYSFDYGGWHIVALNNYVAMTAGSAQEQWLRADLAASTKTCALAFWHEPLFSGAALLAPSTQVRPLFQALYDANGELNIVAHAHFYERYGPQNPNGGADAARGVRQITVGTGGYVVFNEQPVGADPGNRQAAFTGTAGVLKLTLHKNGYDWQFLPAPPDTDTDSGSGTCH